MIKENSPLFLRKYHHWIANVRYSLEAKKIRQTLKHPLLSNIMAPLLEIQRKLRFF